MAAFAAGCADGQGAASPSPVVNPRWESCTAAGVGGAGVAVGDAPRLDDTFQPATAVLCVANGILRPGSSPATTTTELHADNIAALVDALRLPDEKPTGGPCTLEMVTVPWIALLDDAGRWIHPGIPNDACRRSREEVRTALDQLKTTQVSGPATPQPESSAAAAAGCTQLWADMVWVTGESSGGGGTPDALAGNDGAPVQVCIYQVPQGQRGGGKPAGEFESGRTLTPAQWSVAKHELSTAQPAVPCRTPGSRFAVLHVKAGKIYVEADGCQRALIDSASGAGSLRKAGPRVSALLFT